MNIDEAIAITMYSLCDAAEENKGKFNLISAIAEITINGIEYQVQVSLVADKKIWVKENEVRFSEVVKIHE